MRLRDLLLATLASTPIVLGGEKPNVLILLADDLSWHDLGCYGNTQVRTPNIDAVARAGMRFSRAFTATAMCSPTRQQLYTGLFPVRSGAYPNHSDVKEGTRSVAHHLGALGYRVGLMGKTHYGPKASFPFDRPESVAAYVEDDEPFCLIFASRNPHSPWTNGDPSVYPPEDMVLPPYFVDTAETRLALSKYYAEVTAFDGEVGAALEALEDAGKTRNTLVIITTEQGSQFPFSKWTCYDAGLRTGFIVRWPDRVESNSVTPAMIQYVDVVPTLVEVCGGDPTGADTGRPGAKDGGSGFDGRSFLSTMTGETDVHNAYVFGAQTTQGIIDGSIYPVRSVRDDRYKLIVNLNHTAEFHNVVIGSDREKYWASWMTAAESDPGVARLANRYRNRPELELYEIESDPYEMKNLASDPVHTSRVAAMRGRLNAWMVQQGDEGMSTEEAVPIRK